MIRYTTQGGKAIELPKLTMALSEMTDAVESATSTRERYALMRDFLLEVMGEEAAADAIDGDGIEDCDLVALAVTYSGVVDAYAAPVIEEQRRQVDRQVKAMRPALDAIERASQAAGRQGFKNVR